MKIGILTFHFANNYGASLQVYSFQKCLELLGYDSEVINFCSHLQDSHHRLFEYNDSFKGFLKNLIRLPHFFSRNKRISEFDNFRKKNIKISDTNYSCYQELIQSIRDKYDLIFVGSDQVWNPNVNDFNEVYFKISSCDVPVFSYAASLGNAKMPQLEIYKKNLTDFKRISVREYSGVDVLSKIGVNNVCHVLDPTLLIPGDYFRNLSLSGKVIPGSYAVCYFLGRKNYNNVFNYMSKISSIINIPVYFINANYGVISYSNKMINDAGPSDFLSIIKNAKIVFTNSFHATAISMIMGVPFYTFEFSSSCEDRRKQDLLDLFGITNRTIVDLSFNGEISFDNLDLLLPKSKLDKMRNYSFNYINECISSLR